MHGKTQRVTCVDGIDTQFALGGSVKVGVTPVVGGFHKFIGDEEGKPHPFAVGAEPAAGKTFAGKLLHGAGTCFHTVGTGKDPQIVFRVGDTGRHPVAAAQRDHIDDGVDEVEIHPEQGGVFFKSVSLFDGHIGKGS